MNGQWLRRGIALTALMTLCDGVPASSQEVNGTLGAPSATMTIDGAQLPPPPVPFGGVIKETAAGSTPFWPPRIVPPKGAPNVLLIMTDDQGYGVPEHVRRRHPDAGARPRREGRAALHRVPLDRPVLADACSADHRAQSSLGRLWRDRRIVDWLSRLRFRHRSRERHHRQNSARTTAIRRPGSARTTIFRPFSTAPPAPSINGRSAGVPVLLWFPWRRDRPVDALSFSQHDRS